MSVDRCGGRGRGGGDDTSFCGKHFRGRCRWWRRAGVDAGAVAAAQSRGFAHLGVAVADVGQRQGFAERGGGDFVGQGGVGRQRSLPAHDALRLGQHVVALPGRPVGDHADHLGGLRDPVVVGGVQPHVRGGQVGQHRGQPSTPQDFNGLGAPGVALLGQRARLVFGVAGFQGGLLGQRDGLDVGGFAAVGGVKLLGQLSGARFDRHAPR